MTSVPGIFEETVISHSGCDSITVFDVELVEKKYENLYRGICEGDTYSFGDIIATESGIYETTVANDEGCETAYTIDLIVDDISCDENFLSGSIFYDENRNGIQDGNEEGINNLTILVSSGSISLFPDNSGRFWLLGDAGQTYTLELDEAQLREQNLELTTPNTSYFIQSFVPSTENHDCLLYTSPSPRDQRGSRMPSSA